MQLLATISIISGYPNENCKTVINEAMLGKSNAFSCIPATAHKKLTFLLLNMSTLPSSTDIYLQISCILIQFLNYSFNISQLYPAYLLASGLFFFWRSANFFFGRHLDFLSYVITFFNVIIMNT